MNVTPSPPSTKSEETMGLTRLQKVAGLCVLLFYIAMIVVTIATLKFTVDLPNTSTIPLNFN
jgi:hypothetical protein